MMLPSDVTVLGVVREAVRLAGLTDSFPVVAKIPNPRPREFVHVGMVIATPQTIVSRRVSVMVHVVAESDGRAAQVAEAVCHYMDQAVDMTPDVLYWQVGEYPHRWSDPDIPKIHRWMYAGELNHITS